MLRCASSFPTNDFVRLACDLPTNSMVLVSCVEAASGCETSTVLFLFLSFVVTLSVVLWMPRAAQVCIFTTPSIYYTEIVCTWECCQAAYLLYSLNQFGYGLGVR